MKTLLLFGSTGFIGAAIAHYFRKKNNFKIIAPTRNDCNLLRFREVKSYIENINPDYIINTAYIGVNSNVKPTRKYLEDNLKISNNILKASKRLSKLQQIIFFGSGLEYGDSKNPIDELHPHMPKNYYAKTKSIQSKKSLELAKQLDLPFIIIKPFNLYGPYDNKSVFYYVIQSAMRNEQFSVTKGEQVRDILYINDFVELIEKVIRNSKQFEKQDVLNAGYGKGILLQDVITEIINQTKYNQQFGIRDYRNNEYFSQVADITKAKRLVGWEPKTSLREGIKKTIDWAERIDV